MRVPPRHRPCASRGPSIFRNRCRRRATPGTRKAAELTISGDFRKTVGRLCVRKSRRAMQLMSNAGCEPRRRRPGSARARRQARPRRAQTAIVESAEEARREEKPRGAGDAQPIRRYSPADAPAHSAAAPLRRLYGQCARWCTRPGDCLQWHREPIARDIRHAPPATAAAGRCCREAAVV